MKRIHAIISGDVVGVGYRAWARDVAQGLHLTGWVKNRDDDTVELVAEGEKGVLEELISACKKGPLVAWVSGVRVEWEQATGEFPIFSVVY